MELVSPEKNYDLAALSRVAQKLLEVGKAHQAMVLTDNKEHARSLAEMWNLEFKEKVGLAGICIGPPSRTKEKNDGNNDEEQAPNTPTLADKPEELKSDYPHIDLEKQKQQKKAATAQEKAEMLGRLSQDPTKAAKEEALLMMRQVARDKDAHVREFLAGKRRVMFVVQMLKEGFDHPPVSVQAICRKVKSPVVFAQFIGRAMRWVRNGPDAQIAFVFSPSICAQQKNYQLWREEHFISLSDPSEAPSEAESESDVDPDTDATKQPPAKKKGKRSSETVDPPHKRKSLARIVDEPTTSGTSAIMQSGGKANAGVQGRRFK